MSAVLNFMAEHLVESSLPFSAVFLSTSFTILVQNLIAGFFFFPSTSIILHCSTPHGLFKPQPLSFGSSPESHWNILPPSLHWIACGSSVPSLGWVGVLTSCRLQIAVQGLNFYYYMQSCLQNIFSSLTFWKATTNLPLSSQTVKILEASYTIDESLAVFLRHVNYPVYNEIKMYF